VVDNCGLLCHAQWALSAHGIAQLTDSHSLGEPGKMRSDDAGTGTDFVPFGVKVVLDARNAPETEVVGGLGEKWESVHELLIAVGIPPERPEPFPFILIVCSQHGIQLENDLYHFTISLPLHDR